MYQSSLDQGADDNPYLQKKDRVRWHQTSFSNVAAGLIYLATFLHIYKTYINPTWEYTRLYYRPLEPWEIAFQVVLVGITSAFLPPRIDRPSALIIWLLYAFVFIPTIAITFMVGLNAAQFYVTGLAALAVAIILCSTTSRKGPVPSPTPAPPSEPFVHLMLSAFVISFVALFLVYRDILSFASIDDIYTQRTAAAEATAGAIGYIRTYFTYVLSPGLIGIGLVQRRRRWMIVLGFAGFLLSYMIDALKLSLVVPFAMMAMAYAYKKSLHSTSLFTLGIGVVAAISSLFTNFSAAVRLVVDMILLRSIAIPGQTFSLYYDLFDDRGYTYWSNTKIINLFVAPPPAFRSDPLWPVLGYIVGKEFYGANSDLNANANLFAGEGIAAAGPTGVLVIAVALAYWLRLVDRYSQHWPAVMTMAIMVPLGLNITNVHLTTLLLSFGGLFWLLAFRFGQGRPKLV